MNDLYSELEPYNYLRMIICVGLYIVEVSRPLERGTLLSLITPLTMAGTLFVYILGYTLAWRTVALITCIYSLAIFFVSIFIPETPIFYMTKWKKLEAVGSLMWFRRNVSAVDEEIAEIEERIHQRLRKSSRNIFQNFRDASVWKPFLILSLFSLLQQQVGYNILTYYANDFFSIVKPISYESDVLSIISASLSTVGSLMLMSFVHKYKRKTFLYVSGIGMAGSMAIGAITLANEGRTVTVWCVFIYELFCMLGMIDIPWMMIGELFPAMVRGSMSGSISVVIFLIQFVSLKTYPALLSWIGVVGLFWYFALFCSLSVVFVKLYFPETKDKSLFDIEADFRK